MRYPVGFGPLFLLGEGLESRHNGGNCNQVLRPKGATPNGPPERDMESSVVERVNEIAQQAAIDHGLEMVHTEVAGPEGHPVIRVFIDKPGGVTHDDCSEVSTQIGTVLDVEDFIHSAYTLEVSSPGLERGLYKPADYERFAGRAVKIKTCSAIGNQRNFRGAIAGITAGHVILEDRTSGRVEIPFDSIAKANLEVDVESEFSHARERESLDQELIKNNRR
jgi:ribosome maturation factor RimP